MIQIKIKQKLKVSILGISLFLISIYCNAQPSKFVTEGARYPFSCRGSYWTLTRFDPTHSGIPTDLYLNDISAVGEKELLKFELLKNGEKIEPTYKQSPSEYQLISNKGKLGFVYENPDVIRAKGENTGVRISYEKALKLIKINENQYRILMNSKDYKRVNRYVFTLLKGESKIEREDLGIAHAQYTPFEHDENLIITISPDKDGVLEFALERYRSEYVPRTYDIAYEKIRKSKKVEFENWLKPFEKTNGFNQYVYDAAYVTWAGLVRPEGNHIREAMVISKTYMNNIWSWDHCFNALAMMSIHPDVAWNQLMCVFEHQDKIGALPDSYNVNNIQWGHLKQPIHGWTLAKMMEINPGFFDKQKLQEAYTKLEKWTNFWLNYRDDDQNGIVQINHGNDNFDFLPVYDMGFPVEDPHVNMMLAFQMETLSDLSTKLGIPEQSEVWNKKAASLQEKIIARSWNGEKFLHKKSGTEEYEAKSESVLNYSLMMMGDRLPDDIKQKLANNFLKAGLTTDYGVLTESKNSPLFDENSYTRGHIWPPLNLFTIEGLRDCGKTEEARDLAFRYIRNIERVGFGERFAAFTGKPLSDPSYTWTLSIYLYLKKLYDK
ncbi:trehalase family glycosidase [Reichenbachiella sp.]|uniref:amylo-alpha-1,6-glucosidase n=1 Tax=Reichenbachiella sp. TaxID=2184521 RepID=UPI0032968993